MPSISPHVRRRAPKLCRRTLRRQSFYLRRLNYGLVAVAHQLGFIIAPAVHGFNCLKTVTMVYQFGFIVMPDCAILRRLTSSVLLLRRLCRDLNGLRNVTTVQWYSFKMRWFISSALSVRQLHAVLNRYDSLTVWL